MSAPSQPRPVTVRDFPHDGLLFHVTDSGPRWGTAIVLLHGFPQDASSWDGVSHMLNDAGFRTLALQQRGYGRHNAPSAVHAYGLDALAGDVHALLDAAGLERAHVVGHDWGGAVAWHLAGTSPRIITMTSLSTPHPEALAWSFTHSKQALTSLYMALFQLPRLPERVLAPRLHTFFVRNGLPPDHAARYADRFAEPATLTGPMNWYRAMLRTRTTTPRSAVPTTYLWGSEDFALGSAAARRTCSYALGDYRFLEVRAGHWLPETHPGLVAEEIIHRVSEA